MEFCPKCEVRLKNDNGLLSCPKCKFVKGKTDKSVKEKPEETNSEFLVMDESDLNQAKELESTVPIDCEKCHNQGRSLRGHLQTRSADEPETQIL